MSRTPKKETGKPAVTVDSPSIEDAIRLRAYQLWQQDRNPPVIAPAPHQPEKGSSKKRPESNKTKR